MQKISAFILLFCLTCFFEAGAQSGYSTTSKKAIRFYEESNTYLNKQDYAGAIEFLLRAVEADEKFTEAHMRLGDVHKVTGEYQKAKQEYEKVISLNPELTKAVYFSLGEVEFYLENYAAAQPHFEKYLTFENSSSLRKREAQRYIASCRFAAAAVKLPLPFNPVNLGKNINSSASEYLPNVTADGQTLIFTRRDRMGEDFYISRKQDTVWQPAQPLSQHINTPMNEGAQCISPDGQYLFFTGCTREDGLGECDIYISKLEGNAWSNPSNIGAPVNTPFWDSQPSLSADGKTLYFASRRPGGFGKTDIWKSTYIGNGEWGIPQNLGDSINTAEEEISPFIHPDNQTLYFCSEGWPGMGGKDIFLSRRNTDGTWGKAENLGYPINTSREESSLFISADGKKAYFASTYLQGEGRYDLYEFDLPEPVRPLPTTYVKGTVVDKLSQAKLLAKFEVIELETNKVVAQSTTNSATGEFLVCLASGKDYLLNVSKNGYLFYSDNFSLKGVTSVKPFLLNIPLQKIIAGEKVILKNVFFETASYELKPESKIELDKAVSFLSTNPSVSVEIGGHTDNVGNDESNIKLSDNRAGAVYTYLVKAGISPSRLSYKGYGETLPVEDNDTDTGRAANRRTEMKILKN